MGKSIEFIGNSLTCGYGNEGSGREEHFKYETENSYLTYGAFVSRAVKADYILVCRSGIGMYQDYGGDTNFVQPKLYDEIAKGSKAIWSYEKTQPDIVVIELGANDRNKSLDSSAFANSYTRFIAICKINSEMVIPAASPLSYLRQINFICGVGNDGKEY